MDEVQSSGKRTLRYSLAMLLFVSLCIGGALGGYRSGYRIGYASGQQDYHTGSLAIQTYSTMALIWPDLTPEDRAVQVAALTDLIHMTIAPEMWAGGSGLDIRDFPGTQNIIITAPESVHAEICKLFQQLESLSDVKMAEQVPFATQLQALAAQGTTQSAALTLNLPRESQTANVWLEKYYAAAVKSVTKSWGNPAYAGECADPKFPKWSLDQKIALWPRGNGLAYLALGYGKDGQLELISGWRSNEKLAISVSPAGP